MNFFSERILGVAFLAVGYIPPAPDYNYERSLEVMNQRVGYDVFGYWEYFSSKDAAKKLEENVSPIVHSNQFSLNPASSRSTHSIVYFSLKTRLSGEPIWHQGEKFDNGLKITDKHRYHLTWMNRYGPKRYCRHARIN